MADPPRQRGGTRSLGTNTASRMTDNRTLLVASILRLGCLEAVDRLDGRLAPSAALVDIAAVADCHDDHEQYVIANRVDDAVVPNSNP